MTLPAILVRRARETPDRVALRHNTLGYWQPVTWSEYARNAATVAHALRSLGVERGDRVTIHSENSKEWVYTDLGVQGLGAVSVGIYPTSAPAEVEYFLSHSEAKVHVVEDEEQLDKVLAVRDRCPALTTIVLVDTRGCEAHLADPMIITFADLMARGADGSFDEFAEWAESLDDDETALIVYTSGTTGPPKAAMTSHGNIRAAAESAEISGFEIAEDADVLSYLPLCHIAERLVTVIGGVWQGYRVNFGDGPSSFNADMVEIQPHFLLGVPRVWEKMMAGVQIRMNDATRVKQAAYNFWLKQGRRIARKRWTDDTTIVDNAIAAIGELVLYRSLRAKLGLVRCRDAMSGAAPIAPQVLEFFWAIGVPVREGYGQTENTAVATANRKGAVKLGTVGVIADGAELKIAEDGEILTRGAATFKGYFKDPKATAEAIDADGWLHTGDVGVFDDDGYLVITDRKKDIIITAGGKNISPSEIENALKVSPFIKEAVVIGDRRKYLTALIGIELDTVGAWALSQQLPFTTYADLSSKDEVRTLIQTVIDEVNEQFAQVETIKKFEMLPKELDAEEGELTATQKVKRAALAQRFEGLIEGMYR